MPTGIVLFPQPHLHVSTALAYLGWGVRIHDNLALVCNPRARAVICAVQGTAPPQNLDLYGAVLPLISYKQMCSRDGGGKTRAGSRSNTCLGAEVSKGGTSSRRASKNFFPFSSGFVYPVLGLSRPGLWETVKPGLPQRAGC